MTLHPALSVEQIEDIESQVERRLDLSALIEGTGGFSSYPTMIIDFSSMEWVLNTIAHEWTHTYLIFYPLGQHYGDSGDLRTLNETTASIVGDEIGQKVLERFYPERAPAYDWPRPLSLQPERTKTDQFDFGSFMRDTRLQVDKLLAQGSIREAESYMEAQRKLLVANGYTIRRLNQAYFVYHGSYAVGSSATDPIGGKLRLLRREAGSVSEFVRIVARCHQGRRIGRRTWTAIAYA